MGCGNYAVTNENEGTLIAEAIAALIFENVFASISLCCGVMDDSTHPA